MDGDGVRFKKQSNLAKRRSSIGNEAGVLTSAHQQQQRKKGSRSSFLCPRFPL